jgi:3D (Asp-Asp-Asp) domain-containing protein
MSLMHFGRLAAIVLGITAIACVSCREHTLIVTATAYNSAPDQTHGDPTLAAWGDVLKPGMKAIAVSPDLLRLGLSRGVRVRVEGLRGEYVVLDKTASRWRKRIDIYMGNDVKAARAWGKRQVRIRWK